MDCDACAFCDDVCGCERCIGKPRRQKEVDFTMCQVKRHNTPESCWLVAHGAVYDATKFIPDHPAGAWPILQRAGKDCTVDYDFHSKWSKDNRKFIDHPLFQNLGWKPLRIGTLVTCRSDPDGDSSSFCSIA
jgi:Cytochrome b5-like Heme/Steroid binding domain